MEILTNSFKTLLADQFYYSLCLCSNTTYHLVGGQLDEFTTNTIPTPSESVYENIYDFHDKLLFGKTVNIEDVAYMAKNVPWEAGEKYPMYDDKDEDLHADSNFYVVADQNDGSYGVFKCIYKDPILDPVTANKPIVNQTGPEDEVYITGDGYHWKYMYSITSDQYSKFATLNFVPVFANNAVVNNAVSGTIDAVLISNQGQSYNNYSGGRITESAVDGSLLKFSITSDEVLEVNTYDIIYTGNGTFADGDTIDITVPGESSVEGEIYRVDGLSVSVKINANTSGITQSTVASANGNITIENANTAAEVVRITNEDLPLLSNDANFYKDSIIYMRNGSGAGEVREITAYELDGAQKIITVNTAFVTTPDTTSEFDILPQIQILGDGTGAIAVPVIDSTANSIIDVQIVNRGSGYTFASASVSGNTGIIDSNGSVVIANSAVVRPIIAPAGGHGSDPISELYAHNIGISVTVANNDVYDNFTYSKIGLIRNLLHDHVELTLDSLDPGDFAVGEEIRQEDPERSTGYSKARGTVVSANTTTNVLVLTNVLSAFEVSSNNQIVGASANATITSINKDTTVFNNDRRLTVSVIDGTFVIGEQITQANSLTTAKVIKNNTTSLDVVEIIGNFTTNIGDVITGGESGATAIITAIGDNKIIDNSGDTIYIQNTNQITRSSSSSEQVKLMIKF